MSSLVCKEMPLGGAATLIQGCIIVKLFPRRLHIGMFLINSEKV